MYCVCVESVTGCVDEFESILVCKEGVGMEKKIALTARLCNSAVACYNVKRENAD